MTKLLAFVDEERGFERGSMGQLVEAIVLSLPNIGPILTSISGDASIPIFIRECAAFLNEVLQRRAEASSGNDWRVQAERILRDGK